MPSSTRISRSRNMSVITPHRKSIQNVVNSTPVNGRILKNVSTEPTQSPIEKSFKTHPKLTRSQMRNKTISNYNMSHCESSSFDSTPKCSKIKPTVYEDAAEKKSNDDCGEKITINGLSSQPVNKNMTPMSIITPQKVGRSKSNLSPYTKRQHTMFLRLSCSFNQPISLNNSDIRCEDILTKRKTRSFTKLHSDSESSIVKINKSANSSSVPTVSTNDKRKSDDKENLNDSVPITRSQNLLPHPTTKVGKTGNIAKKKPNQIKSVRNVAIIKKTSSDIDVGVPTPINKKVSDVKTSACQINVDGKVDGFIGNDNSSLHCSKNENSIQNEKTSDSCGSLSKRNSANFSSQSSSKPSFIRRKLYSQHSDFANGDTMKTFDASFLGKNDVKNVYVEKKKTSINNQKRLSENNNGSSNRSTCSEPMRKSINTIRTYCLRKNLKHSQSGGNDKGTNSDSAVTEGKKNTCQFIADLLRDVNPKSVPQVAVNNILTDDRNDEDQLNESVNNSNEKLDLFAEGTKKTKSKKRKPIKKPIVKIKQKKVNTKCNVKVTGSKLIGRTLTELKEKESRCISSSDSSDSDECSLDKLGTDRKSMPKKYPVRSAKAAANNKIRDFANTKEPESISSPRGDYSSEENSDESPFHKNMKNRYSEAYSSEEYDSPLPVLKNKKVNSATYLEHRPSGTQQMGEIQKYTLNKKLSLKNYNADEDLLVANNNHFRSSKMVQRRSLRLGGYIVSPVCSGNEENISKLNAQSKYVKKNSSFRHKGNRVNFDEQQFIKSQRTSHDYETRKPHSNGRARRGYDAIQSTDISRDMVSYNVQRFANKHHERERFQLPGKMFREVEKIPNGNMKLKNHREQRRSKRHEEEGHQSGGRAWINPYVLNAGMRTLPPFTRHTETFLKRLPNEDFNYIKFDSTLTDRVTGNHKLIDKIDFGLEDSFRKFNHNHYSRQSYNTVKHTRSSMDMMSWNKSVQYIANTHHKEEEFQLPLKIFSDAKSINSALKLKTDCQLRKSNRSEKLTDNRSEDHMGVMPYTLNGGARALTPSSKRLHTKDFSYVKFDSTLTGSLMNKINTGPENCSLSYNQNNLSYFNKSSTQLGKDTRRLTHLQTLYQRLPEMPLGKPGQLHNDTYGNDNYLADFSYPFKMMRNKIYDHQECLKMNTFGTEDSRKNYSENRLHLSNRYRSRYTMDKYSEKIDSTTTDMSQLYQPVTGEYPSCVEFSTIQNFNHKNQSKLVNFKSLLSAKSSSNFCSPDKQFEVCLPLPNKETVETFEHISDNVFKMPQKPGKKRTIADVHEEHDRGRSKIPRTDDTIISSFSESNVTHASLKGKENLHRDGSYVISGTSSMKACSFQKKSLLAGPISNSTFLGTTLKTGTSTADDIFSLRNYANKQMILKKSFSQNNTNVTENNDMTSYINGSNRNFIESSRQSSKIHPSGKSVKADVTEDSSILSKYTPFQSLLQKSETPFIVRMNNSVANNILPKEPTRNNLKSAVVLSKFVDSVQSSIAARSVRLTPEKEVDIVSQSKNLSPWRFAVLK